MISSQQKAAAAAGSIVKSEPEDQAFLLVGDSVAPTLRTPGSSSPSNRPASAKSEPQQKPSCDLKPDCHPHAPQLPEGSETYTTYVSADDINYSPEGAIDEGIRIADSIEASLMELEIGTDLLHKDVWLETLARLKNHRLPSTMIAVCGATGAGKSSMLNAILDDNIVPTSGMNACTSVVTEIRYHEESMIVGEVQFLTRAEWKEELEILLNDLVDENGKCKGLSDLSDVSEVAWYKVHAVYPLLEVEQLISMAPDDIISSDPEVARRLGKTHRIESPTSEEFGLAIAEFNESQDNEQNSGSRCWPLIRQVRVQTKAKALSCGTVLVDLPGVADANPARSNIAKDYMKECKCIWIVAPIMRAVDDKTARDLLGEAFKAQLMNGNYDAGAITFIASKTDDISCDEMIKPLKLRAYPEFVEIESKLKKLDLDMKKSTTEITKGTKEIKETAKKIKSLQPVIDKCKAQLEELQAEGPPKSASATHNPDDTKSKKRIRRTSGRKAKKTRIESNSDSDSMDVDASSSDSSLTDVDESKADEVQTWTKFLQEKETEMNDLSTKHQRYEQQQAEARMRKHECKDMLSELEKEKAVFCSVRRNEAAKNRLKKDFRQGLKEFRESYGRTRNLNAPLPPKNLSDCDALDLPVFTCSSRDYMRIKKQVKSDGGLSIFTDPGDTEIPALQEWCQKLTVLARQHSARSVLKKLISLLQTIRPFVDKMEDISVSDRIALANMWESRRPANKTINSLGLTQARPTPRTGQHRSQGSTRYEEPMCQSHTLSAMSERAQRLLTQERYILLLQQNKGIAVKLYQVLNDTAADCVKQLKQTFRDELEESCCSGAGKAKLTAVEASDELAAWPMRWQTYRAILRRNGEWRDHDLNVELAGPMVREVVVPWTQVFGPRSELFAPLVQAAGGKIATLLEEFVASAPQDSDLVGKCQTHCKRSLTEAQVTLGNIRQNIETLLAKEQKNISRFLTCHIKDQLLDGYRTASGERGPGTSVRQKQIIHDYIESRCGTLFSSGTRGIFSKLDQAADWIEPLLRLAFIELSEKIEVNISVLWEMPADNKGEFTKRHEFVTHIHAMLRQLNLWLMAGKTWADLGNGDVVMEDNEPAE